VLEPKPTNVAFATGDLRAVSGVIREVEATYRAGHVVSLRVEADGPVAMEPAKFASLPCVAYPQQTPALLSSG